MRKLSEAYKCSPCKHAVCIQCEDMFDDDLPDAGSLLCPNGCGSNLIRVASEREANELLKVYGMKTEQAE